MKDFLSTTFVLVLLFSSSLSYAEYTCKSEDTETLSQVQMNLAIGETNSAYDHWRKLSYDCRNSEQGLTLLFRVETAFCELDYENISKTLKKHKASSVFKKLFEIPRTIYGTYSCEPAKLIWAKINRIKKEKSSLWDFEYFHLLLQNMGLNLSRHADEDNDKVVDSSFNFCNASLIPDIEVRRIATNFNEILQFDKLSLPRHYESFYLQVSAFCAEASQPPFQLLQICQRGGVNEFTSEEIQLFRSAFSSQKYGVGSCNGGLAQCLCH
ncbi:MAG: hypothetical protein KDD34_07365 [Bdellovibrionales bacterium]|nr:hypothetical protein [Bdellovibrionales bacterium]